MSSLVTRDIRLLIALSKEASGPYIGYHGLVCVFSNGCNRKFDGRHTAQICIFWVQLDRPSQSCSQWQGAMVKGVRTLHH